MCERFAMYGDNRDYMIEMRRELVHTWHQPKERYEQFDSHMGGWCRVWICEVCGNHKRV